MAQRGGKSRDATLLPTTLHAIAMGRPMESLPRMVTRQEREVKGRGGGPSRWVTRKKRRPPMICKMEEGRVFLGFYFYLFFIYNL